MAVTDTTLTELRLRNEFAFERAQELLRATDPGLRLKDGTWTCHDVAIHLLTVLHRYTRRDTSGTDGLGPTVEQLTLTNAADIEAHRHLSHRETLDLLATEFRAYLDLPIELTDRFPFHAGQSIDGAGGLANMIGEFLLHGRDVALAAGTPWPLDERDMLLVLNGALQVAPGWLDPRAAAGRRMDIALRIAHGTPQLITIADGRCEIRDLRATDRPHAVISGPAVTFVLQLYGRIGLIEATRRGVRITGGSRPWRGLALPRLFLPI